MHGNSNIKFLQSVRQLGNGLRGSEFKSRKGNKFSSSKNIQTNCGTHPTFYSMDTVVGAIKALPCMPSWSGQQQIYLYLTYRKRSSYFCTYDTVLWYSVVMKKCRWSVTNCFYYFILVTCIQKKSFPEKPKHVAESNINTKFYILLAVHLVTDSC